jgi:secretion/DNA translocation related CpaE-like protein
MRPLLVTTDAGLLDAVLAVAGEARVEVDVVPDLGAALHHWTSAPLVLLDASLLDVVRALPHRPGVVVVSRTIEDAEIWRQVVQVGAEHAVELPEGAPWLFERLGSSLDGVPAAELVAVVGASGGAGTSTLAAALAHHAVRHDRPSALVDLDPCGGGLDLLLGAEHTTGARWDELVGVSGRVDPSVLTEALPEVDGVRLLSWPTDAPLEPDLTAVGHVVDALSQRTGTVVLDAGRAVDVRGQAMLARCQRVVVVVPLRVRAVTAARRHLRLLPQSPTPVIVVREPAPSGVTPVDVERALGHPVTAVLPADRRRAEIEEFGGGMPSGSAWRSVCEAVGAVRPAVVA